MDERRRDHAGAQARLRQPGAVLGGAVGAALGQGEQRRRVQGQRQRAVEGVVEEHVVDEQAPVLTALNKTARLLAGELGFAARSRVGCAILGGVILPLLLLLNHSSGGRPNAGVPLIGLFFCIGAELLERYLFFTAAAPAKMPGNMAA